MNKKLIYNFMRYSIVPALRNNRIEINPHMLIMEFSDIFHLNHSENFNKLNKIAKRVINHG